MPKTIKDLLDETNRLASPPWEKDLIEVAEAELAGHVRPSFRKLAAFFREVYGEEVPRATAIGDHYRRILVRVKECQKSKK